MQDPTVIDMPNASMAEDGSTAVMEFKNSDGSSQILRFAPDIMMQYLSKVLNMFLFKKAQRDSEQGHTVVHPLQVSSTMASEDMKGKAVILQLRLKDGLPAPFAVPPEKAEELRRQLGKALKKLRKKSVTR